MTVLIPWQSERRVACQLREMPPSAIQMRFDLTSRARTSFRSVLSEDLDWKPFPAFPPSVRLAVVVGRPSEAGPYTIRVRVPHGVKLMPHRHPEDRVYTGNCRASFYIGLGDRFDRRQAAGRIRLGSVIVLPGNTPHFHWAKSSEYVTQVTAIGPLGIEYVNATDDPRSHRP